MEYGAGSENSNDTENAEYKNSALCYDDFRQILSKLKISEKDQQYIFKAFEVKSESDIKLFMRYFKSKKNIYFFKYFLD